MIIYNVTVKVDSTIAKDWVQWMLDTHIPEVMNTGCFTHYQFVKLLDIDDTDGPTYATQYFANSKEQVDAYTEEFATALRQKSFDSWGNKFIAFRSLMEVVN